MDFFTYCFFLFNPGNCTAMLNLTFETELVLQFLRKALKNAQKAIMEKS
jgi:hypothetical protein